jgi:hypothetical protein
MWYKITIQTIWQYCFHYLNMYIWKQEPCPSPAECVCSLEECICSRADNSILRDLLVMKTDGWSDYRFETYMNTDGWK